MIVLQIVNFIFCLFIIFITITLFHPINGYKKVKSKEEQLFVQKTLITTLFFISILITSVLFILKIINDTNIFFLIEVLAFNVYIIIIILYNFFLSLEIYYTYTNPVHYFNRLFKQNKFNYLQEFFLFIITILLSLIDYVLYTKDKYGIKKKEQKEKNFYYNDASVFILIAKWKSFFIILFSLISIIVKSYIML